jgi:hypothetical protein
MPRGSPARTSPHQRLLLRDGRGTHAHARDAATRLAAGGRRRRCWARELRGGPFGRPPGPRVLAPAGPRHDPSSTIAASADRGAGATSGQGLLAAHSTALPAERLAPACPPPTDPRAAHAARGPPGLADQAWRWFAPHSWASSHDKCRPPGSPSSVQDTAREALNRGDCNAIRLPTGFAFAVTCPPGPQPQTAMLQLAAMREDEDLGAADETLFALPVSRRRWIAERLALVGRSMRRRLGTGGGRRAGLRRARLLIPGRRRRLRADESRPGRTGCRRRPPSCASAGSPWRSAPRRGRLGGANRRRRGRPGAARLACQRARSAAASVRGLVRRPAGASIVAHVTPRSASWPARPSRPAGAVAMLRDPGGGARCAAPGGSCASSAANLTSLALRGRLAVGDQRDLSPSPRTISRGLQAFSSGTTRGAG